MPPGECFARGEQGTERWCPSALSSAAGIAHVNVCSWNQGIQWCGAGPLISHLFPFHFYRLLRKRQKLEDNQSARRGQSSRTLSFMMLVLLTKNVIARGEEVAHSPVCAPPVFLCPSPALHCLSQPRPDYQPIFANTDWKRGCLYFWRGVFFLPFPFFPLLHDS